eukprot:407406_1
MLPYYLLPKNIMYLLYRYIKRAMSVVLRCYCRYITSDSIQHVSIRTDVYVIGVKVHKAMDKEKSWTLSKSIKDIKIMNNILLQHYHSICGSSFWAWNFTR